jgi:hypothetical protein
MPPIIFQIFIVFIGLSRKYNSLEQARVSYYIICSLELHFVCLQGVVKNTLIRRTVASSSRKTKAVFYYNENCISMQVYNFILTGPKIRQNWIQWLFLAEFCHLVNGILTFTRYNRIMGFLDCAT